MFLFNRSISVNVRSVSERTVTVDGILIDSHHELCLTLTVDLKDNKITDADGDFRRYPHLDCSQTQDLIKKLIGVNLSSNVRRQVQALVGRQLGCTHLTDLTLECVKGLMQAKYQLLQLTMQTEEINALVEKYLNGNCLHYK